MAEPPCCRDAPYLSEPPATGAKGKKPKVPLCHGVMRPTGQTMVVPAWQHDSLAFLRCTVCGERAWYRQVLAYQPLPDIEM
jgi:hypothetical protein